MEDLMMRLGNKFPLKSEIEIIEILINKIGHIPILNESTTRGRTCRWLNWLEYAEANKNIITATFGEISYWNHSMVIEYNGNYFCFGDTDFWLLNPAYVSKKVSQLT